MNEDFLRPRGAPPWHIKRCEQKICMKLLFSSKP